MSPLLVVSNTEPSLLVVHDGDDPILSAPLPSLLVAAFSAVSGFSITFGASSIMGSCCTLLELLWITELGTVDVTALLVRIRGETSFCWSPLVEMLPVVRLG